jgi:3-oxoacyl-[acyl-carrier-protein] synthase II
MRRRVVVTGIGVVCGAADNITGFTQALSEGRRCFTRLTDKRFAGLRATHASLVSGLEANPEDPSTVKVLDRNVHLSLKALREAVENAGLGDKVLGKRAAVVLGTCSGGMLSIERHYQDLARGHDLLDDDLLFSKRYHTNAKVLAWACGISGPALTVVTACAAGTGSIAQGLDLIRSGLVDTVVAGGSDTFSPSTLVGFDALKATCSGTCTPFSETIGLNLGEGAAFFVLEDLEHAVHRDATILAEILGLGLSNDAYHPTAPDPSTKGQIAAMRRALDDSGCAPSAIDYVNAHGTGTRANDSTESRAIAKLLGDHVANVATSSTKSMIGHCLGGAGALEAAATILASRSGFVPPTVGFSVPREGCNLPDYVGEIDRPWSGRIALTNNFGFAGNNVCLLIDVEPKRDKAFAKPLRNGDNKVFLTGTGIIHPLGIGVDPLRDDETSGIRLDRRFASGENQYKVGTVPHIDPRQIDRRLDLKGMDRSSVYATLAVRSALSQAGIKTRPATMSEIGLVLGLATGPSQGETDHLTAIFESDLHLERLGAFPYVVPNEVAGQVARSQMLKGHSTVLAGGVGAGLAALVSSILAVEQGHAETTLAVAADELTERTLSDGCRVGAWGPGTNIVPGEGAAAFVLESSLAAQQRGVPVIAEVLGFGMSCDSTDPRCGSAQALYEAMEIALSRALITADEVTCVTCGSPDEQNASGEQAALKQMFGAETLFISLENRLGFAEASLGLFNLSLALQTTAPNTIIAAGSLSPEGLANAIIMRTILEN